MLALMLASLEPRLEEGWPVLVKGIPIVSLTPFVGGMTGSIIYDIPNGVYYLYIIRPQGEVLSLLSPGIPFLAFKPAWPIIQRGDTAYAFAAHNNYWRLINLTTGSTRNVRQFWTKAVVSSQPGCFDSDRDGVPEIYWFETERTLTEYRIFKYNPSNEKIDSMVITLSDTLTGASIGPGSWVQTFGNFDGDGDPEEIFVITDTPFKSKLLMVDLRTFEIESSYTMPNMPYMGPHAADFDNDGLPEIIFVNTWFDSLTSPEDFFVYIADFKGHEINLRKILAITDKHTAIMSPFILAELDGDNVPEVILKRIFYSEGKMSELFSIYNNIAILNEKHFTSDGIKDAWLIGIDVDGSVVMELPWGIYAPPPSTWADFDADGISDFTKVFKKSGEVIFVGLTSFGDTLWNVEVPETLIVDYTPTGGPVYPFIWDIDNDGLCETYAATGLINESTVKGYLYLSLFELPKQNIRLDWPMLYHDPWNTNNYDFWPPQVEVRESSGKAQGSLTLRPTLKGLLVRSPKPQKLPLKVYDPAGRLLYKAELTLKPGDNLVEIPGKGVRLVMVGNAKAKVVGR